MPKAADSDKGIKHGKEQDKEHVSDAVKESEKKARGSGEAGDNTPPGEEAKEKSRSEEEAIKQRRLRNKVKSKKKEKIDGTLGETLI